ncbi:hypothetical protein ACOBQX_02785 [Actinokineospora sp. G85]|uniref:hypothetical protein n=1 Tax=Actinokineospora sp. G85 TaxID=3406626 RepID=UPI003C7857AD
MRPLTTNEDFRLHFWLRVREFAVPPSMIESATTRRVVGDWAGACVAARFDVDLNPRAVARVHGSELATRVRADLRHLAPDLLRWHFPRISPDGLLRPGLTVSLARYRSPTGDLVHLVARTPPAWASAGQRISLALWESSRPTAGAGAHPHPHPDRRFRLDLHRHLWDARRASELGERSGARRPSVADPLAGEQVPAGVPASTVHRWAAEAALLLRADECADRVVMVRLSSQRRLVLNLLPDNRVTVTQPRSPSCSQTVLPDAATWGPPDLELLRAGLIDAGRLHPLVAAALQPDNQPQSRRPTSSGKTHLVACRGATHRVGVVNGVLAPLDHDPDEIRREELLFALGGPTVPCLRAIDEAHRHPETLVDIQAQLDHGDTAGAVAAVEDLLGPEVLLRDGALRDELEKAARRQVLHGLYRAGLACLGPAPASRPTSR